MGRIDTLVNCFTDICDVIRDKTEKTDKIKVSDITTEILNLPAGGAETPEVGFTIDEWDSQGYATKITVYGMTSLPAYSFGTYSNMYSVLTLKNLKKVILPEGMAVINNNAFRNVPSLISMSLPESVSTIAGYAFFNNTGLKAVWIGSAITNTGILDTSFYGCNKINKMYINLPRATVEAFSGYSTAFSNNAITTDKIICNDDEGFITKEQFDAIDWATYTE